MSADAKLKAYINRILRCREVEDEAKQDTKDVYAELAADGYEKAIVGQVVTFLRKREKDGDKVAEQSAKFDLYLEAYERPSHAHAREDRSDSGLNIHTKHEDIRTAPETAEEISRPAALAGSGGDRSIPSPDAGGEKMDGGCTPPGRSDDQSAFCNAKSGQATNTNSELLGGFPVAAAETNAEGTGGVDADKIDYPKPRQEKETIAAMNSPETASEVRSASTDAPETPGKQCASVVSKDEAGHNLTGNLSPDQPLAGGDHEVAGIAMGERDIPTSNTGEGAANPLSPQNPSFGRIASSLHSAGAEREIIATPAVRRWSGRTRHE